MAYYCNLLFKTFERMNMSKKKQVPKRKPKDGCSALLIWNVPIDLKAKFKAACNLKRISMERGIINLMEKFCS